MPKTYKNRKHPKKLKNKAGSLRSFRETRSALRDLDRRGIPNDVSDIIFKEFAASRIQDRFNDKNLQRIVSLLNQYPMHIRFSNAERRLLYFINNVNIHYEFNDEQNMLPLLDDTLVRVKRIIRFYNEPQFLQSQLKIDGYLALRNYILDTISRISNVNSLMRRYMNGSLNDYRMSQFGIEIQPTLRNSTTRRAEAIVRPPQIDIPRNMATTARRTRSHE